MQDRHNLGWHGSTEDASTGFNIHEAFVLMNRGSFLKSLASRLVLMKISKLVNEGLFSCVTIDIITANPFLIANRLKQRIV